MSETVTAVSPVQSEVDHPAKASFAYYSAKESFANYSALKKDSPVSEASYIAGWHARANRNCHRTIDPTPSDGVRLDKDDVLALFRLAGFQVSGHWRLENRYWPDNEHYSQARSRSPWWLVKTQFGMIEIGWRKRVVSIFWGDCPLRSETITDADVTMLPSLVHCYSYAACLACLTELQSQMDELGTKNSTALGSPND